MCIHLVHPNRHLQRTGACCPLLNRFEHIDRWTCPGMSWTGHFSPSKLPLRVRDLDHDLIHGSVDIMRLYVPNGISIGCFCRAHDRDRSTDQQTTLPRL